MNNLSLMIVFSCIYMGYSFPFDMNEPDRVKCIDKLLSGGLIELDSSDSVTGYVETSKGKELALTLFQTFGEKKYELKSL